MDAVRTKKNGKEISVKSHKRAEKIRVCFDILANSIAGSGSKNILLRIIKPDGNTLAIQAFGSGTFKDANGQTLPFTSKATIEYNQKQEAYCMYWAQEKAFIPGPYAAEIYHEGFLVGTGNFKLKKGIF